MRAALITLLMAAASAAPADVTIDLRASDPVAALPAVSSDGVNFLRPYRRWRPRCKRPEIHVEMGGIDRAVEVPEYATAQLVGGCGEPIDAFAGNVSMVNESLHDTKCSTAPDRGTMKATLPATFVAGTLTVQVTATRDSVLVLADPRAAGAGARRGGRRAFTAGVPIEVHGWYLVDRGANRALAVQISARETDGTVAEQWIDVWLDLVPKSPGPLDVARAWLRASARYGAGYDPAEVAKTTTRKLPRDLTAHKKALSKPGLTLVEYTGADTPLVLGIKSGKVTVVAEPP